VAVRAMDRFDSFRTMRGRQGLLAWRDRAENGAIAPNLIQSVEKPDRTRRFDLDQNASSASAIGTSHTIAVRDHHDP